MIDYEMNEYEGIKIERTSEFSEKAERLSNFVSTLPLGPSTNNRLVELMVEQVKEAERGAFAQGFRTGREFGKYESNPPAGCPLSKATLPS